MEKYINTLRSDYPEDVMKYLNEVMKRLADIESENSLKDKKLYNYDVEVRRLQQENLNLHNQVNYYRQMESTLNNSMAFIKNTGEQIRSNALKERETIIADAKNTASRILNDALLKSERINNETNNLQKNMIIYKNKVKALIECQMEIIDDIEKIDI